MKLYFSPGACSMAPHIVLNELGLAYEPVEVDIAKTHKVVKTGEDYFRINPKGYVPAIQLDDGSLLTEVAAILQYLADRKPETGLLAAPGSLERYRTIEWLTFISSELHKGFGVLWHPPVSEADKQYGLDKLKKRFELLDKHLADHEYLMGKKFTVADAYAYTIINWSYYHKLDLGAYKHLQAYMRRIAARPSVRSTAHQEKLAA